MRIGVVLYPTFGGSGVVATELGKYLATEGHEIHFITYSQPVRLDFTSDSIYYHEVRIPDYPLFQYPPYETALASRLVDVAVREHLDLIHVHYAIPHAFAAYMAKMMLLGQGISIPIVTTLHGTDITLVGKHPSYKPAVTFSIEHSDYVTSVSESLKSETRSFFGIQKPIEVIPNFIDFQMYRPNLPCKRDKWAAENERIVVHISNFRKLKRTADVIRIFEGISNELPARLLMIGDGPDRDRSEQLVWDLGLSNRVRFIGKSTDIAPLLCISDLFLLPSESESFGLAALEAMACHVPAVTTNAGGLPEVNVHGQTGYLADVGDVNAMVQYGLDILRDTNTLEGFKTRAYDHAQKFSVDRVIPSYVSLYERAVQEHKAHNL